MGYSNDPAMVRVDFFKPSGKWYDTEAVNIPFGDKTTDIHGIFRKSVEDHLKGRLNGMTAVCLHPNHELEHPLMIHNIGWVPQ